MTNPPFALPFRSPARSMGLKLIVVCGLAVLMILPALFVGGLLNERTHRAAEVVADISSHLGGQQTFLGPTLVIPYHWVPQGALAQVQQGTYIVFPAHGAATIQTTTEERRRSLFKVPVYQAALSFEADFDLTGVPAAAPAGATLDWSRAEIVVGVSDVRGALADATVTVDGKRDTLVPAATVPDLALGDGQKQGMHLTLFGAAQDLSSRSRASFHVASALRFSGAQRIAVLAYGKTTQLSVAGDWPSPGFDGGFLPVSRSLSPLGFHAQWSVPYIARGVRLEGPLDALAGLQATSLGVSFIEVADPYQSVERSLKYIPLFLGLVFLSYFIFEVTAGKRVHPAQYILVGVAQIIFYLLLLSLAERIGFNAGFLIGGGATVLLLSANAGWIFASRMQAARAFLVFTLLYSFIYLLLRLEDNALLLGAVASFVAVAATMYLTRGIDWYTSLPGSARGGEATAGS